MEDLIQDPLPVMGQEPLDGMLANDIGYCKGLFHNFDVPLVIETLGPLDIARERPGKHAREHPANRLILFECGSSLLECRLHSSKTTKQTVCLSTNPEDVGIEWISIL